MYAVGWSQTFQAEASHSEVSVGERVKITYTLEGGDGKKFIQPTFDGFRLLSGPNTSSNMQWVNGNFSSSESFSFVLLAMEEGQRTIPSAGIKTNGTVLQSNKIDITITKAKQGNKSSNQNNSSTKKSGSESPDLSANIFMKQYVSKREAYVGEQIIATYKLYVNAQVVNYANNRPVYNGFYAQEIELDPNAEVTTETLNGKQYRVATMKKVVLTAQKAGDIEVSPLEMEMVVRLENNNKRRTNWNPWGSFKDVKYELQSNVQTIKVKPLPTANQPANFAGAVGEFKLNATTDLSEIKVNEAVNLTINIEGRGNIDLMAEPNMSFPKDFETYEPKVNKNVSVTNYGTSGKKTFAYVVIPRYVGEFELPSIAMSYFEPKSGTYKTLETDPIVLNVLKSGNGEESNEMAYVAPQKEDVQILGNDIRYIATRTNQFKQENEEGFYGSPSFYTMTALPFAAMGLSVFLIGRIRKQESNIGLMKSKKANRVAKKHLAAANKLLNGQDADFYEEIYRALYGYISDKLNIPVSDLTKESIADSLMQKQVPHDTIHELTSALNECEMARFAPSAVRSKNDMLEASSSIIEKIEDAA